MPDNPGRKSGNAALRFFGMETRQKALEVIRWQAPYLGLLLAGFLGLSLLVQQFQPLPLWTHAVAMGLGVAYLFLFLARVREVGSKMGDDGESESPEEEER